MIKLKRIIIAILMITLILSSFSAFAYGLTYYDVKDSDYTSAIDVLSSYGIIGGYPDGSFRPDNNITRAEAAKIATVVIGYDEYTKGMTSDFTDMNGHWAERYVEIINALRIIEGYQDKTFRPGNYITYTEAVTMIIRMLGYTDEALGNDYPNSYYEKAESLNLTDGVNIDNFYITRKDLCKLIYNSLLCETVHAKSNSYAEKTGKKLINYLGSMQTEKIDTDFASNHRYMDLNNYLLNTWDVYYDLNGKIKCIINPRNEEVSGYLRTALSSNIVFVTDNCSNTKIYDITDADRVFNGADTYISYDNLRGSTVRLIFDGERIDGVVSGIVAKKSTDTVVMDRDNLYKPGSYKFADKYLPLDGNKPAMDKVRITGSAKELTDIKTDDVVYFYETNEKNFQKSAIELDVVREKITGTVNKIINYNYQTTYTIDNKEYNKSADYVETENVSVNDKVEAILDKNEDIIKLNITKYGKSPESYGLVLQSTNTSGLPTVRIMTPDGKTSSYTLKENCGVVNKKETSTDITYTSSLAKGNIIKYDLLDNNTIKIVEKKNIYNIKSYYNENSRTLTSYNYTLDNNTFVLYKSGGSYSILSQNKLGNYIDGQVVLNASGKVEAFILENGLKIDNPPVSTNTNAGTQPQQPPKQPVTTSYSGTLYGIISSTLNKGDTVYVKLCGRNDSFIMDSSTGVNPDNYKNTLVKVAVHNDVITSITKVSAENSKSKVTGVYTKQIQIDGVTYVQYSDNVVVYSCTTDANGAFTNVKYSSINEVKVNSTVQFYDIYNNYDGVIDVILIYN